MIRKDIEWLDLRHAFASKPRRILLAQQLRFLVWKAWLHRRSVIGAGISITARVAWKTFLWILYCFLLVCVWGLHNVLLPCGIRAMYWLHDTCKALGKEIGRDRA